MKEEKTRVSENELTGMNLDVQSMIAACTKTVYAYARVSTDAQDCQRQYEAFEKLGIDKKHTITDKVSGKDFDRPEFKKLMKRLKPGDLIVCKSLDRFGRSVKEVDKKVFEISCEKQAGVAFIDTPQLNRSGDASTLGYLLTSIMFLLQSFAAENERNAILKRTAEGRRLAREKGVVFGRRLLEPTDAFWEMVDDVLGGTVSQRKAEERLGVNHRTMKRWLRMARVRRRKEALEEARDGLARMREGERGAPAGAIKLLEELAEGVRELEGLLKAGCVWRGEDGRQKKESEMDAEIGRAERKAMALEERAKTVISILKSARRPENIRGWRHGNDGRRPEGEIKAAVSACEKEHGCRKADKKPDEKAIYKEETGVKARKTLHKVLNWRKKS